MAVQVKEEFIGLYDAFSTYSFGLIGERWWPLDD